MPTPFIYRRAFITAAAALGFGLPPALAAANPLYQARTIVTGRRDETRIPGLKLCLVQVLVRVSGDPRLETHPLLAELAQAPEEAVTHTSFRDLYAFRPIKDEQGTRDRPHEMTVEYDQAKIDTLLRKLGSRPWLSDRPRLVVFLAVKHIGSSYVLSTTNDVGALQRQSFEAAAWKFGMQVTLPSERLLTQSGLSFETLPSTPLATLQGLVDSSVGDTPLSGTLTWSRELLGWRSVWHLNYQGAEQHWRSDGGNFDAAFRNAIGGAAQIFSGNGTPG